MKEQIKENWLRNDRITCCITKEPLFALVTFKSIATAQDLLTECNYIIVDP